MALPSRWSFAMFVAGGALLGATMIAWLIRVLWIVAQSARATKRIPRLPAPLALPVGAARAGAGRVECVSGQAPVAFCHGGLRPSILVSTGLVSELSADELVAVLAHEQHHVGRGDPLRRAIQQAMADVLFWLPVVHWWADRRREASELAADRAAIRRAGRPPLAAALWKVGSYLETNSAAAFAGVAELRVAQLLGDDLRRQQIPMSLWMGSAAGVLIALNSAWCVAHLIGSA